MSEEPQKKIEQVIPVSPEELKSMEDNIPSSDKSIFSPFDENNTTIPGVIGGFMGLQNKDPFSIFERTIVDPEELSILRNMKRIAEHSIGIGSLDRPNLVVAAQLVDYCRLKVSIRGPDGHGMSRAEAVESLVQWTKVLEAREAQLRQQQKGVAG